MRKHLATVVRKSAFQQYFSLNVSLPKTILPRKDSRNTQLKAPEKNYWLDLYWIFLIFFYQTMISKVKEMLRIFCQTIDKPLLDSTESKTRCQESFFHHPAPISHTEKHTIRGFRGVKSNEVLQTSPNSDSDVCLLLAAVLPWAASQIKPSSHLLLFCWSLKSFHWETTARKNPCLFVLVILATFLRSYSFFPCMAEGRAVPAMLDCTYTIQNSRRIGE